MQRYDIINHLIKKNGYQTYLEVGVQTKLCFNKIELTEGSKISVDPDPSAKADFVMTSDDFFASNKITKYDICLIDGMHVDEFVYRDILNALDRIEEGGAIICHDMHPESEITQRPERETKVWYGNCWKAWVRLRSERPDLTMYVIDTDCGCGVIQKGSQQILNISSEDIKYDKFDINRKEWLNLISVDEFLVL